MTIGNLLYRLTADTKKLVRNIETTSKKHIKCLYAQVFNKTCILCTLCTSHLEQ